MLHAKDMQIAKIIKLQGAFYNNFKLLTHFFSDFTEFTNPNNILVVQFQPCNLVLRNRVLAQTLTVWSTILTLQPPPHANRQGSGRLLALLVCPSLDLRCGI
jgi:hypothetical protein